MIFVSMAKKVISGTTSWRGNILIKKGRETIDKPKLDSPCIKLATRIITSPKVISMVQFYTFSGILKER